LTRITTWIKGQTYGCFDKTEEADRYLDKTNEENKQEAVMIFVSWHCVEGAIEANNAPVIPSLNIGTLK